MGESLGTLGLYAVQLVLSLAQTKTKNCMQCLIGGDYQDKGRPGKLMGTI